MLLKVCSLVARRLHHEKCFDFESYGGDFHSDCIMLTGLLLFSLIVLHKLPLGEFENMLAYL